MTIKKIAQNAAIKSGKKLLTLSKKKIHYTMKNELDIQAEADLISEKIIIHEIKKYFPKHNILSEEKGDEQMSSDYLWIIDPIDGTINYSRGLSEYCISIAVSYKNKIILGVLYNPVTKDMYCAEKGKGAYLNNKRILVSSKKNLLNMILATDISSNKSLRIKNFTIIKNMCTRVRGIRTFGSAALHLAKIAEGKIDLYFKTSFNYWDYAAGILLINEAGGRVTDFKGKTITRFSKNIAASNGLAHTSLLKMLE